MKNLHTLLFAFLLFSTQFSQAQGLLWAKSMGNTTKPAAGLAITTDLDGSVITTGYFGGTVDFDPGPGVMNLNTGGQNQEIFIQKLNPGGDLMWAKSVGGNGNDYGYSIVTDSAGNIYILGAYDDVIDFDPGPGVFELEEQLGAIFILKLDRDGNFLWVKSMGGARPYDIGGDTDDNYGDALKLDAAGNIIATFGFNETVDFDPGPDTYFLTSAGGSSSSAWDAAVLKLDAAGNFLWAKNMGSNSYNSGIAVAVDKLGNVYSTGYFSKTVDFDPGPGVFNIASKGGRDIFIQKLDPDGNFLWAGGIGESLYDESGYGLAVNDAGEVYLSATFSSNNMDVDPGPGVFNLDSDHNKDIFVLKLDTDGNFIWAKQIGGVNSNNYSRSLRLDRAGNVYHIGEYGSDTDFDPGPGVAIPVTPLIVSLNMFVNKLDPSGNHVWVKTLISNTTADKRINALTIDFTGEVYTTGRFNGTVDFDPGEEVLNLQATPQYDIFVSRLGVGYYWDFHGSVFADKNLNGVRDSSEKGIPNIVLWAQTRRLFANTDQSGNFHFYYNVVGDTVRPKLPAGYENWVISPEFATPVTEADSVEFAAIIPPGIIDVKVTAVESPFFRPGFPSTIYVEAQNRGSETADSVWLVFRVKQNPNPLAFEGSNLPPTIISADSIAWLIGAILPDEKLELRIGVSTIPGTPIGSYITYEVRAVLNNDVYLLNNTDGNRSLVVGSFDPNDKSVSHENLTIQQVDSTTLRYVVRFQNTGNFPADFVVIRDTLTTNLDIPTLQVLSASHPFSWRIYDKGVLEFRFDPIFLPDSTSNEPASHGFVAFSSKLIDNLVVGNWITNRAGIYFDYNAPIITNYAITKITAPSVTNEPTQAEWLEFALQPNPVARHAPFSVSFSAQAAPTQLNIFDLQGKLLQNASIPAGNTRWTLRGLPAGSYWIQLRSGRLMGGKMLVVE